MNNKQLAQTIAQLHADAAQGIALGDEALKVGLAADKNGETGLTLYCALVLMAATKFLKETNEDLDVCREVPELVDLEGILTARAKRAIELSEAISEGAKVMLKGA